MNTPSRCGIHPLGSSGEYLYVGMVSRFEGRLLLSRQRGRTSWETQGGHIEAGETPLAAAKRELFEEAGATDFALHPVCDYRAKGTSGVLFFADIKTLGPLPAGSEMEEVQLFDGLPGDLTHPAIARAVYEKLKDKFTGEGMIVSMDVFEAIGRRRSVRKFTAQPVAREAIEEILLAATKAPSAKNRQPWRFVVAQGAARDEMAAVMRQGLIEEEKERGQLPGYGQLIAGAHYTLNIMEQAPVTVFVLNPEAKAFDLPGDVGEGFATLANIQSTGAAIQNLILAAEAKGLGSLWICDVFQAYQPLLNWLGTDEQLVAAVTLGYPAEAPAPRPRRPFAESVEWK